VAPPNVVYKELQGKVQMIELTRLTPTLEWEGRSAMVPVVIDCRIVSVRDFGTPSDLFPRLDTLAADAQNRCPQEWGHGTQERVRHSSNASWRKHSCLQRSHSCERT
jgi:hypothetical protein